MEDKIQALARITKEAADLGYVVIQKETLADASEKFKSAVSGLQEVYRNYEETQAVLIELLLILEQNDEVARKKFKAAIERVLKK